MMSNMSEDIQYAGSDTRPPMLNRIDFESWQQRIRPERVRVFTDLAAEEKERYKADIHAMNILLQGIPKDIYELINHYTDAKDIWDNVKMILEGSELTKDDRESENNNAFSKSEIETQMQRQEEKVNMREAVDAGLVVKKQWDKADKRITSSLRNNTPQAHTEQSEPNYDTHLLETIDSNTTPTSTNMCHRGGEIDQDALLKTELLKTNDRESPEFHEFFEINDLKAQLQAKTTLICNLKNQIKSVKEASNEPKVKHDIDVLKTINIKLESSVAKLLAENEKINKENEHLTQTYKDLCDSIKKTRIQTKDHNDLLIAQVNSKTVENADLKAQIQKKFFANVALKNELRKLKGNSMDTKFTKPSILGKPILQPPRNQSVVRQPNAFKSERPNFSKPRFASQVDVINVLNSQEELYSSSVMAHNHYLEEARKKTQERNRNSRPSVMHTTSLQNTANGSKPNPRSNNQISRSFPVSKSSCGMSNGVSLVDHSRNSSSFFDLSICHKYIFNTNHDDCITKILNKVNSHAKVQSPKIRNNNPVEPKNHTHKPGRRNGIGQRFSLNKSSAVHEKPHTPRSYLRWKPTGSSTQVQEFKEFKSDEHASNDVWTKQFKPRSSSKDVWTKQYDGEENSLPPEPQDEMNRSFIAQNSYRLERETFSKSYRSCRRILSSTFQLIFQEHKLR
ncbi:hypothetical protein Tco_0449009 [Tanacetum coccineum]